MRRWLALGLVLAHALTQSATASADAPAGAPAAAAQQGGAAQQVNAAYSLDFDPAGYVAEALAVDGKAVKFRAYEDIVYVRNPVDPRFECLNFYVPEEYCDGRSIGGYTVETAPIFFPITVGGYMPGEPGEPGQGRDGGPNAALVALSKGYVVAAPGARGRTTRDERGRYTGKAPACIVDLKAAVRYLRRNDPLMPGSAEKIVSNGTSAGGALSALVGASGNDADYQPYLQRLGAAEARDDIFAASCYCPITNLDHADAAYEWQFHGVNGYKGMKLSRTADGRMQRSEVLGTLTTDQVAMSKELKSMFPGYLNSLGLKTADGTALTLDAAGDGTFRDHVRALVMASAQVALDGGKDLSALTWMTIRGGKVADLDFDQCVQYATRMKTPPAFDGLDLGTPENGLFGTATVDGQHFTRYAKDHDAAGGPLADAAVVKMMNPMGYIGTPGATTAKHWRIRHGTLDRDTSLAVPVILAAKLENAGADVDFALPWDQPHGGDYDLDDLFAWMGRVCR